MVAQLDMSYPNTTRGKRIFSARVYGYSSFLVPSVLSRRYVRSFLPLFLCTFSNPGVFAWQPETKFPI